MSATFITDFWHKYFRNIRNNWAMENNESTRKPIKGRGIDPSSARRMREERSVQIRKEKRFDRANIERRKVCD